MWCKTSLAVNEKMEVCVLTNNSQFLTPFCLSPLKFLAMEEVSLLKWSMDKLYVTVERTHCFKGQRSHNHEKAENITEFGNCDL